MSALVFKNSVVGIIPEFPALALAMATFESFLSIETVGAVLATEFEELVAILKQH